MWPRCSLSTSTLQKLWRGTKTLSLLQRMRTQTRGSLFLGYRKVRLGTDVCKWWRWGFGQSSKVSDVFQRDLSIRSHSADCCGEYWCHGEKATHLTLSSSNIVHHQILSTMKYSPTSNAIMRRYKCLYLSKIQLLDYRWVKAIWFQFGNRDSVSNTAVSVIVLSFYKKCMSKLYISHEITVVNIVFIYMISP